MERLVDALERLRPLLDELPIGVQLIDSGMRYRYLNRVAAAHARRSPDQLLGRTMQECYPGIETTDLFRRIRETIAGGAPCEVENAFEFPDGQQGWFELRMFKLDDGIAISSVDITRRKLLQVHHRHAQRMDATRQLAGGIAHDFNNLLTIVGAYTALVLEDQSLSAALRADLGQVVGASNRAAQLSRRLLSLSRHAPREAQRFDLATCLRGVVRALAPMLGQEISLRLVVDDEVGSVEIDPAAFERVIVSLALYAKNAMNGRGAVSVQASPIHVETARYEVDQPALAPGDYVEIVIADDGPGITAERLDRIFDPRLEEVERVGTGLGLAMCWSAVEQAGGTIHVESQVGTGSTFRVVLPRFESLVDSGTAADRVLRSRATAHLRVLVVEDEAAIRELVSRQLELAGHSVAEAADGEEALEQISTRNFDIVISDVLMPVMGGFELARRLDERGIVIPILFMSGFAPDDSSAPPRRWPLLGKPFTTDMLLHAVEALLNAGAEKA